MNRSKKVIGLLVCAVVIIVAFSGCSTSLTKSEINTALSAAIKNSLSSDLYYWKETDNRTETSQYKQVNVLSDIDSKEYVPLVDENGEYTTLRIQVIERENGVDTFQSVCGESSGLNTDDKKQNYLFETVADGDASTQTKTPMTAKEYFNSEQFQQYAVQTKLECLDGLTVDDMDFSVDGSEISEKGHVVQLQFKVKDEFLNRYEEQHGAPSLFAGSKRVLIEIAYEKISQIVVYVDEAIAGTSMTVETEAYNFQIVYLGPTFSVPHYNEVDSSTGEPVWKDT